MQRFRGTGRMNERQLRQHIHSAIIGEFLQDRLWITKASEEDNGLPPEM